VWQVSGGAVLEIENEAELVLPIINQRRKRTWRKVDGDYLLLEAENRRAR
jgi:hypothetical protein